VLAAASTIGDVIWPCLVLIGAICVLGAAVWLVRRWSLQNPPSAKPDPWSLQDLRELKADGRITEEEFQALRQAVLESTRGTASAKPPEGERHG
jgi:hypothetical protein